MTATLRGVSPDGRGGSENIERHREFRVIYKVTTDDKNDGTKTVMAAAGVPTIGDTYNVGNDSDAGAVCVDVDPRQAGSPWEWEVTCTFSTDLPVDPSQQSEDPLAKPTEVSYGTRSRRVVVPGYFSSPGSASSTAGFDQGVKAPNGELFVPAPEADLDDPVVTFTKNIAILPSTFQSLANAVNSVAFLGAGVRQWRLEAPQAIRKYDNFIGGYYFTVSYSLVYRFETWDIQLLNQGSYYLDGTGKKVVETSTETGHTIQRVNLTSTGGKLSSTASPTFTRIRFYRELNFNALNLT